MSLPHQGSEFRSVGKLTSGGVISLNTIISVYSNVHYFAYLLIIKIVGLPYPKSDLEWVIASDYFSVTQVCHDFQLVGCDIIILVIPIGSQSLR